jgi:hypothetical protein
VLRRIIMVFAITLASVGGGLATSGVGLAASAQPGALSTAPVVGTWNVSYCWNGSACGADTWTINANKTFSDSQGGSGTWSFSRAKSEFHIKYTGNACGANYISGWAAGSMGDGIQFTNFSSGCAQYGTWTASQSAASPARARSRVRADGVTGTTPAPAVSPVVGTWNLSFCWNTGCGTDTWTINANKTFSDGEGVTGTWSYKSSTTRFKLNYSATCSAVYIGAYTGSLAGVQYTNFAGTCAQTGTWSATKAAAPASAANRTHSLVRANGSR